MKVQQYTPKYILTIFPIFLITPFKNLMLPELINVQIQHSIQTFIFCVSLKISHQNVSNTYRKNKTKKNFFIYVYRVIVQ
jgi:hypothetical protein